MKSIKFGHFFGRSKGTTFGRVNVQDCAVEKVGRKTEMAG